MKSILRGLLITTTACLTIVATDAQQIACESFTGLPLGSGFTGSGTDATGWTSPGWASGSDSRYQVVDATPNLTFQPLGATLIDGSVRAIQMTTSPEPVSGSGLVATRSIPSQNTTVYLSFLVRPTAIGTGADSLDVRFNQGSTLLARIALQPDLNQQYLSLQLPLDGGSGGGSGGSSYNGPLYPAQTYLVVARVSRPTQTKFKVETWVNPPGTLPGNAGQSISKNVSSSTALNSIGLGISSTDTGGPASTAMFDHFRVGYTWADVVPPGPPPPLVPDLTIGGAIRVSWVTQAGKSYQIQFSYDLTTWVDFGNSIAGDGSVKTVFDTADPDARKFYRVQIE